LYDSRETLEEAEVMVKDAIKCYCASLIKYGEPISIENLYEETVS